eukprot:gnl/TRDRNA2_/TRDRNA2_160514_c4_seq1.p1 gnl/TRDRNA2_/TRDRNA2_160514_c4~~gnl/TRDRNA2_/TRDRNA2_160514_c4_seq1.p1  ORF type:complete len:162 (+),score=23.00 gnl/TRDRNA2_/TRDRNA2_160514_c4_seq1:36-488(+)
MSTAPRALKHSWPSRSRTLKVLTHLQNKYITARDIMPAGFLHMSDAEAYVDFYHRFDFLVHEELHGDSIESLSSSVAINSLKLINLDRKVNDNINQTKESFIMLQKSIKDLERSMTSRLDQQLLAGGSPSPEVAPRDEHRPLEVHEPYEL